MLGIQFIKAQPTTYLLQFRKGQIVRQGAGLSFFFYAPNSTVVAVPVASRDSGFMLELVTSDFQNVTVQGQISYRVRDPQRTAALMDFSLQPNGQGYASEDPQRLGDRVAAAMASQALLLDLALAPGGLVPPLIEAMDSAGPFGMGWPGPRVAVGPVRLVKVDVVGSDHVRLIARGDDGASFKGIAFRAAESDLGQALLHGSRDRRLWLAGRAKIDDWSSRPQAELHVEDAAFAD